MAMHSREIIPIFGSLAPAFTFGPITAVIVYTTQRAGQACVWTRISCCRHPFSETHRSPAISAADRTGTAPGGPRRAWGNPRRTRATTGEGNNPRTVAAARMV